MTELWREAHAACNGNRDAMWDWLEARLRTAESERDRLAGLYYEDHLLKETQARLRAVLKAMRDIESELRFRASATNAVGQIDPALHRHLVAWDGRRTPSRGCCVTASTFKRTLMSIHDWTSGDWDQRLKDARLQQILAESTASDTAELRLALAKILVEQHGVRTYGSCGCAGERSCSGHVPETVQIARAALGLEPLPDKARVPLPDLPWSPPKKKKRKKKHDD